MKYFSFLIIMVVIVLPSCKSAKKATTEPVKTSASAPLSISSILKRFEDNEIKANWLTGSVDMDYQGSKMGVSASSEVRFRRDSVIWMNIKKLGFNVARAKVTPDSVFAINYFENSYIAYDLKYIETKYNVPADFKLLQNIILGNPIFLTDKNALKMEQPASGGTILKGSNAQWQATYSLDTKGEILQEMLFEQPNTQRKLKIKYENYDVLSGYANDQRKFPYIRTLNVESPQTGNVTITLEVDKDGLEINIPKSIKFEIPAHYSRTK